MEGVWERILLDPGNLWSPSESQEAIHLLVNMDGKTGQNLNFHGHLNW